MKLHTEQVNIERFGVIAENQFTIKTTAKAFDILSSGIYTDPIRAIIRELACNAYDAHVAVGKANVPFDIHLPGSLQPWFSITDYGPGLSDEQIQGINVPLTREDEDGNLIEVLDEEGNPMCSRTGGLYTTYFDSTKTDSNDFIGALGLGSKSPFAYAKTFEVTSWYNGNQTIYSVFINEDGIPSIAKLGTFPTERENGLSVKIVVNPSDFHSFREKAAYALRWIPTMPNVTGTTGFTAKKLYGTPISGKGWQLYPGGGNGVMAVQGWVEYPVQVNMLSNITDVLQSVLRRNTLVLHCSIGELEVAASREELRYDKRTVAALEEKIDSVMCTLRSQLVRQLTDCIDISSDWNTVANTHSLVRQQFDDAYQSIMQALFPNDREHPAVKLYFEHPSSRGFNIKSATVHSVDGYGLPNWRRSTIPTLGKKSRNVHTAHPSSFPLIVINDLKIGGMKRLATFMDKKHKHATALCIKPFKVPTRIIKVTNDNGVDYEETRILTPRAVQEELDSILNELGNPDVIYTSQLPTIRTVARGVHIPVHKYNDYDYYKRSIKWLKISNVDATQGTFIYLQLNKITPVYVDKNNVQREVPWGVSEFKSNVSCALRFIATQYPNLQNLTVSEHFRGVSTMGVKNIRKLKNWMNLIDLIEPHLDAAARAIQLRRDWDFTPDTLSLKNYVLAHLDQVEHIIPTFSTNSLFREMLEKLLEVARQIETIPDKQTIAMLHTIGRLTGHDSVGTLDTTPICDLSLLTTQYPMIKYTESSRALDVDTFERICEYVTLIDNQPERSI